MWPWGKEELRGVGGAGWGWFLGPREQWGTGTRGLLTLLMGTESFYWSCPLPDWFLHAGALLWVSCHVSVLSGILIYVPCCCLSGSLCK